MGCAHPRGGGKAGVVREGGEGEGVGDSATALYADRNRAGEVAAWRGRGGERGEGRWGVKGTRACGGHKGQHIT